MKVAPSQGQSTGASRSQPISISPRKTPRQATFFFEAVEPGSFDDDSLVRSVITASIRSCILSRDQIADAMTRMLGVRVTAKMLNNYTSEAMRPNRWPGAWDRAFCAVTGDDTLLSCRAERAGFFVISAQERDLLELGRQYLTQKRAGEEAALLERRLVGVEL